MLRYEMSKKTRSIYIFGKQPLLISVVYKSAEPVTGSILKVEKDVVTTCLGLKFKLVKEEIRLQHSELSEFLRNLLETDFGMFLKELGKLVSIERDPLIEKQMVGTIRDIADREKGKLVITCSEFFLITNVTFNQRKKKEKKNRCKQLFR